MNDLDRTVNRPGLRAFYLVGPNPPSHVEPENTERLRQGVDHLAGWTEVQIEPELAALKGSTRASSGRFPE